jgi:hypothetical protein
MPLADRLTVPVKPLTAVTVTNGAADPPCGALTDPGAEIEKSGAPVTVTLTVVE